MQSTLTPLAVAFIIIGQILVDQVNHGCIIGRIVKSSATFCRRKLHLDFSIPRPCVDGYLNL
ncbi:hypothetical protein EQK05_10475 [Lactiplantibacillus plantarum]|nr:hypothetical protein EQK05_10475 [Lactiplantibacillus plantarum]